MFCRKPQKSHSNHSMRITDISRKFGLTSDILSRFSALILGANEEKSQKTARTMTLFSQSIYKLIQIHNIERTNRILIIMIIITKKQAGCSLDCVSPLKYCDFDISRPHKAKTHKFQNQHLEKQTHSI